MAPFSTTTTAQAAAFGAKKPTAVAGMGGHIRAGKKQGGAKKNKKKLAPRSAKPPLPGERKAIRKRIQLSNNNALAVPGLAELVPGYMLDPKNIGTMVAIPGAMQDNLRTLEAFKPTQFWPMFRQPAVLVRSETVQLMNMMQAAAGKKEALRMVISGERVTGKSLLLLQSMAHAFANDWIVINIPEGQLPEIAPDTTLT